MAHMEKHWKKFWILLVTSLGMLFTGFTVFFVIIDPYDILEFSPEFNRAPMVINQRFGYPSVARNPEYDSVVIGTSTARLFQPNVLNKELEANFAQLAMNSATTYEQFKIFEQFRKYRKHIKHVVFGVDDAWCSLFNKKFEIYTSRPFPEWMYDDNDWNDYPNHYTLKTMETALKQFLYLVGLRPALYSSNGYQNFLLDDSEYDIGRARELIYGSKEPKEMPLVPKEDNYSPNEREQLPLKALKYVQDMVNMVDDETEMTFVVVPFHFYKAAERRPIVNECIRRIQRIASGHHKMTIVDFMIASDLTTRDDNYWDDIHYRLEPSFEITRDITDAIKTKKENKARRFIIRDAQF